MTTYVSVERELRQRIEDLEVALTEARDALTAAARMLKYVPEAINTYPTVVAALDHAEKVL